MADTTTIDSNSVGFRIAEETSYGVVAAGTPWIEMEPNDYGDFGAQYVTVARAPINAGRQRQKGKLVDMNASLNFGTDFLWDSLQAPLEGYLFSTWQRNDEMTPTAVTGASYTVVGSDLVKDMLILAKGFANDSNNGLKVVTATGATTVSVAGLTAEAEPPTGATIKVVGFRPSATGGLKFVSDASGMRLTATGAGGFDVSLLALREGEAIFIGGDEGVDRFGDAALDGMAIVKSVPDGDTIVLSAVSGAPVSNAAGGKRVFVFVGDCVKNEKDAEKIICRSYTGERKLGVAGYEYTRGAVPNTLEMSMSLSEIVTCSLGFVAQRSDDVGPDEREPAAADLPVKGVDTAFNTTSDLVRIRLADDKGGQLSGATYATEFNLSINNNVTVRKALTVLGGISVSAGDFVVSGTATFYFSDVAPIKAIRANADIGLDFGMVADNRGVYFNIPLVTLGDGRKSVEKDQPITLPLSYDAAESEGGYTMAITSFAYLPNAAQPAV